MKELIFIERNLQKILGFTIIIFIHTSVFAATFFQIQPSQEASYIKYKGKVFDAITQAPIAEAHLTVKNSEITTITNAEGNFILKVPQSLKNAIINISKVGYHHMNMQLVYFDKKLTEISLSPIAQNLEQIDLYQAKDARKIVQRMLDNKGDNYGATPNPLTAFYREKIDRGNRNVMLAEAVVSINKANYTSSKRGKIFLYKTRKHTDYKHLDTLALKLRGGPYTPLYLDILKYPQFLFYENSLEAYEFTFDNPTKIDDRYIYVIRFEEMNKQSPWYHGKMYIDAKSLALVKAIYSLNVDNRNEASRMLIFQKPWHAKVYPLKTRYQVDYLQKDGKWYYSYGHAYLKLKINWKHKLFNARYAINSEMVVTDRSKNTSISEKKLKKIKPSVIMSNSTAGFTDPSFWGSNNIIEPDVSIQEAIEKIRKKVKNN